jgi:hypothetical protein
MKLIAETPGTTERARALEIVLGIASSTISLDLSQVSTGLNFSILLRAQQWLKRGSDLRKS